MRYKNIAIAFICTAAFVLTTIIATANAPPDVPTVETQETVVRYETYDFGDISIQYPAHWNVTPHNNAAAFADGGADTKQRYYTNVWLMVIDDPDYIIKTAQERVDDAVIMKSDTLSRDVVNINGVEAAKITHQRPDNHDYWLTEIYIPYKGVEYYCAFLYNAENDGDAEIIAEMITGISIK